MTNPFTECWTGSSTAGPISAVSTLTRTIGSYSGTRGWRSWIQQMGSSLWSPPGSAVVSSGEIYNCERLRSEIGSEFRFRTGSDSEVLLPLFQRHGPSMVEELRAALERAVGKRLMSDVPVGAFLSGGIDSSIVAALVEGPICAPDKAWCSGHGVWFVGEFLDPLALSIPSTTPIMARRLAVNSFIV